MAGEISRSGPAVSKAKEPLIGRLINCVSFEETMAQYKSIAGYYDGHFRDDVYLAPRLVAEGVLRMFPEDGETPRSEIRVLDVAAGTGLAGQNLYEAGITHLDALEPSSEMMALTKARGIYQRLILDSIGDHGIDVDDNTYDAVTMAGGFVQGHCPLTALDEMIRVCKPGGYIINSMRLEYLVTVPEYQKLQQHMQQLEDKNQWRRVHHIVTDGYYFSNKQGFMFIYQKV